MTEMLDKPARALDDLGDRAEQKGGVLAKAADDLHADADFLQKIGGSDRPDPERRSGVHRPRGRGTPNRRRALIVIGGAFVAGIVLGTYLQWRSLVEPRH